jgi:hypothetical protein
MNSDNCRENILEPELAVDCKQWMIQNMVSNLNNFREKISETELAVDCIL